MCPGPVDTEFFNVSGNQKNPWKKLTMVKAPVVVHQALKDSRAGRSLSIYGLPMKAVRFVTGIVPHGLILRFEK